MQMSLAQFLKQQGVVKTLGIKPFVPTATQEKQFLRITRRLIKEWTVSLNAHVLPAYKIALAETQLGRIGLAFGTGSIERLEQALNEGAARTATYASSISPQMESLTTAFAKYHMDSFVRSVRQSAGVSIEGMMTLTETQATTKAATRRFVSLIKGLDDEMRKKVESAVIDSFNSRTPINELRKRLVKDLGFAEGRAKIIAQDQVGKYTVELDRIRHEQFGIKKYVWITMGDDRVRDTHAENDGKLFSWNTPPPITGHPGNDINCRCRPLAYIEPPGTKGAGIGTTPDDPRKLQRKRSTRATGKDSENDIPT